MKQITDELREWAHGFNGPWRRNEEMLLAIADRIDAKHERTFRNLTDALHKQEDATRELAEKSVLLPVDADGVPIRVGDVMWQKDRITKRACKAIMGDAYVMLDGIQGAVYAKGLTHYHATTVEDVLLDACKAYHGLMIEGMSDVAHDMPAPYEIIAEYAAKLRMAKEVDA